MKSVYDIVRMPVKVYLPQKAVREVAGLAQKNDYVSSPQQKKRNTALKDLQKQIGKYDCDLRRGSRD